MNYYAVHYTYVTDTDALTAERPAHRDYLRTLGQGGLLAATRIYTEFDAKAKTRTARSWHRR